MVIRKKLGSQRKLGMEPSNVMHADEIDHRIRQQKTLTPVRSSERPSRWPSYGRSLCESQRD